MNLFGIIIHTGRRAALPLGFILILAIFAISTGKTGAAGNHVTSVADRTIRSVSTTAAAGGQVTVSIEMDSLGDEGAISFSLGYNPNALTNPVVTLGSGVPAGTILSINQEQLSEGRVGVLLDGVTPFAISPPARQLITVKFDVPLTAPLGQAPIVFIGIPTGRSVATTLGVLVPAVYNIGAVTITPGASMVTIGGRVTTPSGQNLRNTVVTLIDANNVRRTATTSSFGIYSFADVQTGATYTLTVSSKRYRFSPLVVNVTAAASNLDLVGLE